MTVLEIVNTVLRRLREDPVTALAETSYSRLVVDFLRDIHEEVLTRHEWSSMEHTVNVPLDASQRILDLSRLESNGGDVDDSDRLPTVQSVLKGWSIHDDATDAEDGHDAYLVTPAALDAMYQRDRDYTSDRPNYIAIRNHPDRDGLELSVWPPATSARHIRLRMWTPEAEIDPVADAGRSLLVPHRVLELGTLYLALNERGEEIGEPGGKAETRYYDALGAAVEADANRKSWANGLVAQRD